MPLAPLLATSNFRPVLACGGAAAVLVAGLIARQAYIAHELRLANEAAIVCRTDVPLPPPPAPAAVADPAPVRSLDVKLVFTAGGASYLDLAEVGNRAADDADDSRVAAPNGLAMPRHGAIKHVDDDNVQAAIAPVALADVPMMYAPWIGRRFRIDEGCEARVVGFAVVSRLTGEPSYADVDSWTARSVMKAGQPVLAAQLDGCKGTLARDASLPAIVFPVVGHDAALEQAARDLLLGSPLAAQTQREWDQQLKDAGPAPATWTTDAEITTKVLHHPTTGKTFVSVQAAAPGACGAPEANIWALYEATERGLVQVTARKMTELQSIDQLVDIDGDGAFELIGSPWINNEQIVLRSTGERLESLATPFYGCPC